MLRIVQVNTTEQRCEVQEIFREYLDWTNLMVEREFNIRFDVNAFLMQDMSKLQQFAPPSGRLLLAEYGGRIAGCACLRKIGEDTGEIKRMYVRSDYRRKGIGLALLETIINEAQAYGYTKLRLDSASYAQEAQALYRKIGFQEIEPYPESEAPPKYYRDWVFMELVLKS